MWIQRLVEDVVRVLRSNGGVVPSADLTGGDIQAKDCAHENLICGFWLVGCYLVAGFIDTREGQVPVLAYLAARVGRIGHQRCVSSGFESVLLGMRNCERHLLSSVPVAGEIAIAVHQCNLDTVVQKISHVWQGCVAWVCTQLVEAVLDGARRRCPVQRYTDGLLHVRLIEESLVELRRRSIDRSDVEVASVGSIAVPVHDVGVAESLRRLADRIDCCIVAQVLWITIASRLVTVHDLISASTRHVPSFFHILHLRVVDGFNSICVVGSDFDVGRPHRQTVGTTVDDEQCVQIQFLGLRCAVASLDCAIIDLLVLLFEIGTKLGTPSPSLSGLVSLITSRLKCLIYLQMTRW